MFDTANRTDFKLQIPAVNYHTIVSLYLQIKQETMGKLIYKMSFTVCDQMRKTKENNTVVSGSKSYYFFP
jgi:hypothetical protein